MFLPRERATRALHCLHWSARELARILNVRDDTALKWLAGRLPFPPAILAWLERLAAFHDANPPPARPTESVVPTKKHALAPLPLFTCPRCGRQSAHPKDIEHRYCGACHEFFPLQAPRL